MVKTGRAISLDQKAWDIIEEEMKELQTDNVSFTIQSIIFDWKIRKLRKNKK